jgi:acetylornithine deacetylase
MPVTDVAELLAQLVALRTDQREEALVARVAALTRSWGATNAVTEVLPGRPNLVATFPGHDPSVSLMLEAHADVVAAEDRQFQPQVRAGRLYGRGACDTKGPMAAMLMGIRQVLDEDGQPPLTVHFVTTCNEELGARGAHALMASGFRPTAAVVGEPTELEIVHACKGVVRIRLTTHGVAAHSSDPSRGVNAIYKMRRVLTHIEEQVAPALSAVRHPLLGSPTVSVGTIRGGTQVNVVPDRCEIEVDRRLVPAEDRAQVIRQIIGDCEVDFEESEYYPPLEQDPDSPIVQTVQAACPNAKLGVVHYAANAGVFKAAGVPCVLFGPGSVKQAHTAAEFIELEQLQTAVGLYAGIIRAAAKHL